MKLASLRVRRTTEPSAAGPSGHSRWTKAAPALFRSRLTAPLLLLAVLGLGLSGIRRSLWLDESWVANSIQVPTLSAMFHYTGWLQVTPPVFLLLARAAVHLTGPSNAAFRIVPLLFSLAAAGLMLAAARRVLTPALAALATALVVFDPTAIEYSHTLKPYSAELAVVACLLLLTIRFLERPDSRRFASLAAAVAFAIPLAYSSVFLVPGIGLAVFFSEKRRGVFLSALAGTVFLATYWFSIRPNFTPGLHSFFASGSSASLGLLAALAFCIVAAARTGRTLMRSEAGRNRQASQRTWTSAVCLLLCLLLAASGALGWYPLSNRTRLFALPCFVLAATMLIEDVLSRIATRRLMDIAAAALAIGVAGFAIAGHITGPGETYEEDFDGAVAFLAHYAAPSDMILVHACCKEGFLLYSRMDHWNPPHLVFGDTGWPCCVPGRNAAAGSSTTVAVVRDVDSKVPRGYSGRVWLLYTTRSTHWSYTGFDEGNLWRGHLWDRGCLPGPYIRFANLAVSPMNCAPAR